MSIWDRIQHTLSSAAHSVEHNPVGALENVFKTALGVPLGPIGGYAVSQIDPAKFVNNLGTDVRNMAYGFGPGLLHIGSALSHDASRLAHGHASGFQTDNILKGIVGQYTSNDSPYRHILASVNALGHGHAGQALHEGKAAIQKFQDHPLGPILDATAFFDGGASLAGRVGQGVAKSARVADVMKAGAVLSAKDARRIGYAGLVPKTAASEAAALAAGASAKDMLRGGTHFVPATRNETKLAKDLGKVPRVVVKGNAYREMQGVLRSAGADAISASPAGRGVLTAGARVARIDRKTPSLARRREQALQHAFQDASNKLSPADSLAVHAKLMDTAPADLAAYLDREHPNLPAHDQITNRALADTLRSSVVQKAWDSPSKAMLVAYKRGVALSGHIGSTMQDLGLMTPEQLASRAMLTKRLASGSMRVMAHPTEVVPTAVAQAAKVRLSAKEVSREQTALALEAQASRIESTAQRASQNALRAQKKAEARLGPARDHYAASQAPIAYATGPLTGVLDKAYNEIRTGAANATKRDLQVAQSGTTREALDKQLSIAEKRKARVQGAGKLSPLAKGMSQVEYNALVHGKFPPGLTMDQVVHFKYATREMRIHKLQEMLADHHGMHGDASSAAKAGKLDAASAAKQAEQYFAEHYYSRVKPVVFAKQQWIKGAAKHYVEAIASGDPLRLEHFTHGLSPREASVLERVFPMQEAARFAEQHGASIFDALRSQLHDLGFTDTQLQRIADHVEAQRIDAAAASEDSFARFMRETDPAIKKELAVQEPVLARKAASKSLSAGERKRVLSLIRSMEKHRHDTAASVVKPFNAEAAALRARAARIRATPIKEMQRLHVAAKGVEPLKLKTGMVATPDGKALHAEADLGKTAAEIKNGSPAVYAPHYPVQPQGSSGFNLARRGKVAASPLDNTSIARRNTGTTLATGRIDMRAETLVHAANRVGQLKHAVNLFRQAIDRGTPLNEALAEHGGALQQAIRDGKFVLLHKNAIPGLTRKVEQSSATVDRMQNLIHDLGGGEEFKTVIEDLHQTVQVQLEDILKKGGISAKDVVLVPSDYYKSLVEASAPANRMLRVLNDAQNMWRFFMLNLVPRWVAHDTIGAALMLHIRHAGPALWSAQFEYARKAMLPRVLDSLAHASLSSAKRLEAGSFAKIDYLHSYDQIFHDYMGEMFGQSFVGSQEGKLPRAVDARRRQLMGTKVFRGLMAFPNGVVMADRLLAGDIPRAMLAVKLFREEAAHIAQLDPAFAKLDGFGQIKSILSDPVHELAKNRVSQKVMTDLIDYGSLSEWERSHLVPLIPFYSWLRGITVWTATLPVEHPWRTWMMAKTATDGHHLNKSYGLPSSFQDGYFSLGNGKFINTGSSNPIATVGQNFDALKMFGKLGTNGYGQSNIYSNMNPILKAFMESLGGTGGKDSFSQRPLMAAFHNPQNNPYDGSGIPKNFLERFGGQIVNGLPQVQTYWQMRNGSLPQSTSNMRGRDYLANYFGSDIKKLKQ